MFTRFIVLSTTAVLVGLGFGGPASATDYYVASNGSDTGSGTSAQPFRTIQRGVDAANKPGDTVTVAAGVYREEVKVQSHGTADRPIVIKAAEKQAVVLDGADRVTGWSQVDVGHNIWSQDVAGKAPYSNGGGRWDMPPRSEQVFVDGKRCLHVKEDTAREAMPDYSFTATMSDPAQYALKLPAGVDPNAATTEVTVRGALMKFNQASGGVLDGFTFRRGQNTYQMGMVGLNGEALEVRNCVFEYSSAGSGMQIGSHGARIHDNTFQSNGEFGFSLGGENNILENNLVTGNDLAGYKEWGTGGTKIVGNGNILRHNRFTGNLGGVAIWLDSGPCNNVIEYNYVSGNYGEGIRAEISYHNYIGYNIVESTQECIHVEFGKTQPPHNIGISVQNSAETVVCNNFLKDNTGVAIQLYTYNRKATDLPQWQERYPDEKHREWLRKSWDSKVIYANDNMIYNNVIVQTTPEAKDACIWARGILNGEKPHCYGNQIDYNFYWNSVTHAPKARIKDLVEIPDEKSQWRTTYGLDTHGLGGFSPDDYLRPVFGEKYPYAPTAAFAGLGKGKSLGGFPGHQEVDYLGNPADSGRGVSMGHIEDAGK
ncbi:MAG: right-handed parallel beta-helix repeat-containing protein [Candidatus Sumerlaeota bacterium]|nr:right-handed parallel beta-helix repeat-containing protein [Candidatus Sumerlaeota bacterium]